MLARIEEINKQLEKNEEKVVLASQDVVGLYPNLSITEAAAEVGRAVEESSIEFKNVDMEWVVKTIAMGSTETELVEWGIIDLIPKRRYVGGSRPGLSSDEAFVSKSEYKEEKSKWDMVKRLFSNEERKKLLGKMFQIGVRECFRNHVYKFNRKYYVQREGGAIGLRLTGVVAEISMAAWEKRFRNLVERSNVDLLMSEIYVDDQNIVYKMFKKGTRWNGEVLSWNREWEEEDVTKDEADDKRCTREMKKLGNSIREDIVMEEDVGSNYTDGKLPMLDMKVWLEEYTNEEGFGRQRITTEFYEKSMVGDRMLMEMSALPRKVKITSLSQMVLRRCTNHVGRMSRDLKVPHLSKLMFKMKKSG